VERDWQPEASLLGEFSTWLLEQELADREEIDKELSAEEDRELALRYIHAEIFNSAFGLEERYRIIARSDDQIQTALELFDQAEELLAERRILIEGDHSRDPLIVSSVD
jgi:hypothetical protein